MSYKAPLASILRPASLAEVIGQQHLVGPNGPLYKMAQSGSIKSLILWGPPGTGKTTIARAIAKTASANFVQLNATSAKVDDVRKAIKDAGNELLNGRPTIVFVDEIQRFSKSQQDVLLPAVEDGTIVLIGTTTEKPKFAVNSTIISRCSVWEVKPLSVPECMALWLKVQQYYKAQKREVVLTRSAAELLFSRCSGDARKLVTSLETIVEVVLEGDKIQVAHVETAIPEKHIVFDRSGNEHFDHASAYQNSIQNSDADGAVYWLAQWLSSGEEPTYVARRMLVTAFEDCASNPMAPVLAMAACYATENIGMPECNIALAYATIVMAQSERNKTAYRAIKEAMVDVQNKVNMQVPDAMRAGSNGHAPIDRTYVWADLVERANQLARGEVQKVADE